MLHLEKLDILDREKFVEDLLRVVENISENKSSTCFALNGEWGCGKSFVLDMFEEKLAQIQAETTFTDKYFVIRYNCWKYDYYEEPLIAIVSELIAVIEEKIMLFPEGENKHKIVSILRATRAVLFAIANSVIKERTGEDLKSFCEIFTNSRKNDAIACEKEHSFDIYFSFKKVIAKLSEVLKELAQKYSVIIVVDELDRCLPEYAIKILERLHHLTEETKNIITIIAIDKKQLMSSVNHAFGFENPEKYLEKFFHFEVKLDNGVSSDKILEKYEPYISLFDKKFLAFDESIEECLRAIFNGLDMRTQEQIIQKAMLTHKLLFNEKKDYSFMCMELLLAVVVFIYNGDINLGRSTVGKVKTVGLRISRDTGLVAEEKKIAYLIEFFDQKFMNMTRENWLAASSSQGFYTLRCRVSLYGAILYAWYLLCPEVKNGTVCIRQDNLYDVVFKNREDMKKYFETIHIMK